MKDAHSRSPHTSFHFVVVCELFSRPPVRDQVLSFWISTMSSARQSAQLKTKSYLLDFRKQFFKKLCSKNAVKSTRIWCGTRVPGTRCALLRVQNARQTRGSNMMCLLQTLKYSHSRYCPRRASRYHRTVKTALTRDVYTLPWRPCARVWSQKVPQISGFNMHCQT